MLGETKEQSKGLGSKAKRPEPEGREEPRPGSAGTGRVWKKPLGVKPQQGKVTLNINIFSLCIFGCPGPVEMLKSTCMHMTLIKLLVR